MSLLSKAVSAFAFKVVLGISGWEHGWNSGSFTEGFLNYDVTKILPIKKVPSVARLYMQLFFLTGTPGHQKCVH